MLLVWWFAWAHCVSAGHHVLLRRWHGALIGLLRACCLCLCAVACLWCSWMPFVALWRAPASILILLTCAGGVRYGVGVASPGMCGPCTVAGTATVTFLASVRGRRLAMHDLCAGQEVGCVVTSVLGRRSPTPWIACEVLPLSPVGVPPVLCLAPLVLVGRIWIRCVVFWLVLKRPLPKGCGTLSPCQSGASASFTTTSRSGASSGERAAARSRSS